MTLIVSSYTYIQLQSTAAVLVACAVVLAVQSIGRSADKDALMFVQVQDHHDDRHPGLLLLQKQMAARSSQFAKLELRLTQQPKVQNLPAQNIGPLLWDGLITFWMQDTNVWQGPVFVIEVQTIPHYKLVWTLQHT